MEYIPEGKSYKWNLWYRDKDPEEYLELSKATILKHARALIALQKEGAVVFDYGNQLREQAEYYGLAMRKKDGTSRRFAFIGYATPDEAEKAKAFFDGAEIVKGRPLAV